MSTTALVCKSAQLYQGVLAYFKLRKLSKYLFHYMRTNFIKEIEKGTAKSTVESIRLPMLLNFSVCIPPIKEQQDIAAYLDEKCAHIDSLIADKETLIREFEDYKKALIYEYVTGKKEVE